MSLTAAEMAADRQNRETIAPILANGVVCAMRDQPSDPATYMAEFLAVSQGPDSSSAKMLDQVKFGQECARLDAELADVNEQLAVARAERAKRLPDNADADAQRNAAIAAAAWAELRRLKRIARSMKIKLGEPLSASDWPIQEGVILVQGGPSLDGSALAAQLNADFGVGHIDVSGEFGGDQALGAAYDRLQAKPTEAVLLNGYLSATYCRTQLERVQRAIGKPTAVLLLQADAEEHATRIVNANAEAGTSVSQEAAQAQVRQWASDVTTIEAAVREIPKLPVLRVDVSGDFNTQMTNMLVACTSV